jgi:16S rRNA (cytosine967-C5)-methyltransferase
VQELAYGTLRHWGRLTALTQTLAAKPLADHPLAALIAIAIYQLDLHAPAFAVVDRAVEAAALMGRPKAKPLVNALLRRYLRERDALNAEAQEASPVARWSYPRWWIGRVEADHPQHWTQIRPPGTSARR